MSRANQDDLNSLDDRAAIRDAIMTTPGVEFDQVLEDWGEFDTDHPQSAHNNANAYASNRSEDGIGIPTEDELNRFYDDSRPYPGLRIIDQ